MSFVLLAYIGPGAGFALAGSSLAILSAILSAATMLLFWPVRRLIRFLRQKRPPRKPRFRRIVILGLDGLDYGLTRKLLDEGKLPHLAALQQEGGFKPLGSTLPPISPVAWSSFQTGVNPGKHNIFDFLVPDERTYQPKLSSVEIRTVPRRIGLGPLKWTVGTRPDLKLLRKSQPFWSVLGHYGIFSCIQRVPITFPPEKLHGVQLSAMCVPDLRGTQGTFSRFTTRAVGDEETTGGEVQQVARVHGTVRGELIGPPHPSDSARGPLKLPFTVALHGEGRSSQKARSRRMTHEATLHVGGAAHPLRLGEHTDWITVRFRAGRTTIRGVCRFVLCSIEPDFELYATPINIDPERPAMPIGYPSIYPIYLAKRQGPYATLGLAEDTWGLSEQVLDDGQFAQQCLDIEREREAMFFDGLDKVGRGLCVCVFDGTDRMQHMFWRYHDPGHPARKKLPRAGAPAGDTSPPAAASGFAHAIEELYVRMDGLVGRTVRACRGDDTLLMVLSDHGFTSFRRGVDLNRWLEENGYLVVDDARRNEPHLAGIDWSRTRAFAIGLTGIFINLAGRFDRGIVPAGDEADRLRGEIAQKLAELADPETGERAVKRVYVAGKSYRGPYKDHAPDLIVGYAAGYRVSWEAAVGRTSRKLFHDNTKAWSGDHCVDPSVVPGVLFCNRPIETEQPRLLDIGPTVLDLFGVPVPAHMDGRPLQIGERRATAEPQARSPAQGAPAASPLH